MSIDESLLDEFDGTFADTNTFKELINNLQE